MSALPVLPRPSGGRAHEIEEALRKELLSLSYRAFQSLVSRLLQRMGYTRVHPLGRVHRRGRTAAGGSDLSASVEAGVTRSLLLLQIKQYRRPVSRRFVDELRGTCIRRGAEHGMLVTTSTFSRPAWRAALLPHAAPVRLVDGTELVRLLIRHRIGTRDGFRLDVRFFRRLRRAYPEGSFPAERAVGSASPSPGTPAGGWEGDDMTWRTHTAFAAGGAWFLLSLGSVPTPAFLLSGVLAAFGALLPDLDSPDSFVSRLTVGPVMPLRPLSLALFRLWGHRGPLHSWIGIALALALSIPLWPALGPLPALSLPLGYASHLLLDGCTRTGIPLFYPDRRRRFLLPRGLRFTTGSLAEEVVTVVLAQLIAFELLRRLLLP